MDKYNTISYGTFLYVPFLMYIPIRNVNTGFFANRILFAVNCFKNGFQFIDLPRSLISSPVKSLSGIFDHFRKCFVNTPH